MKLALAAPVLFATCASNPIADWPAWGGDGMRNMVSDATGVPASFEPGTVDPETEQVDMSTTKGVRWVAKLGSQTYGNPTVSGGQVFVGTNNAGEGRPGITGDYSLVKALDEADGSLNWQFSVPKLGAGKVNDWEFLGICSSPTSVDQVVYVVTNRCEVVALDASGLSNGNDGYQDEGQYMAGPGKPALDLLPEDADILWRFDMADELGVFPHNVTSSSVLVVDDTLFVTTSNGTDWSHLNVPSPFSPALIALDRHTGKLLAEEVSGISERTMHSNWSTPAWAPPEGGRPGSVLFGAGDGFLYGFDAEPTEIDGLMGLKEQFRYDANDPGYRLRDGEPIKYATFDGPSEIIGTPVYADGLVFVAIGQDPEHGPGVGRLSALEPADGSWSPRWTYDGIQRTISTVAVSDGLVYAADYEGRLHAVDLATGEAKWVYDTKAHIWGSPLVVDGKVFLGNEDGVLTVLQAGPEMKLLAELEMPAPIYSSPIVANGTLYLATQTHLYAVGGP